MHREELGVYAFFDGDNVGNRLEILLTEEKIEEAVKLSQNIQAALVEIEGLLKSTEGVSVIIIGGDDILIEFDHKKDGARLVAEVRGKFYAITGNTMSCGVAEDIPGAIWSLHLAKLYGKDMVKGVLQ
jgi:hypothetical protein